MSLSIRVKRIQEYYDKNASQFAVRLGHDRSETIRNVIVGKTTDPKSSLINEILIACPEVDARWLITGEGEMLKSEEKQIATPEKPKDEYGFCMECVKKDIEIKLLEKQATERDEKIYDLQKTVGSLEEQLRGNNGANGDNHHKATG